MYVRHNVTVLFLVALIAIATPLPNTSHAEASISFGSTFASLQSKLTGVWSNVFGLMQSASVINATSDLTVGYSFDESSGQTVTDVSINKNNGTINGASWTTGNDGTGLAFNGSSNYVQITDLSLKGLVPASASDPATDFTLMAWVKLNNTDDRQPILVKQGTTQSGAVRGFMLAISDGVPEFEIFKDDNNKTVLTADKSVSANAWHHVAVTYDYTSDGNSKMTAYVNGVKAGNVSNAVGPVQSNSQPLDIGRYYYSSSYNRYLNGALDDVRIYSRTLSASDIATIVRGSGTALPPIEPPPTSSTCTSFTYSAWGSCQSDSTQTRNVESSSPSGCTGGTSVTSQSCTYVPPTTGAKTYYIDFSSGSDGNSGTAKSSPWKKAPGMSGFSGSYNHKAGDRFIFKGGVTWDNSALPLSIVAGGSSGNVDYYGVDDTWFNGSSFKKPIFDAGYVDSDGILIGNLSYITIDGLEISHVNSSGNYGYGLISGNAPSYVTIKNCYLHGWRTSASTDDAHGGVIMTGFSTNSETVVIDNCEIENSENSNRWNGVMVRMVGTIRNSHLHHNSSGVLFTLDFDNNEINNISHPSGTFDPNYHANGVYLDAATMGKSIAYIRNSIFHDVNYGANMSYLNGRFATIYNYNNIYYGEISDQKAIEIEPYDYGANTTSGTYHIYNNTGFIEDNTQLIRVVNRSGVPQPAVINIKNNHVIGSGVSLYAGAPAGSYNITNNLVQTPVQASVQGYTVANLGKTTSTSGGTIDTGTNPSSIFTKDIVGKTRPSGAAWDIGAYEYTGTTPPPTTDTFTNGDRIKVTSGPLNVRSTANGVSIGSQNKDAIGTIVGTATYSSNYWWWNVNFDNSPDGWVAEDFIGDYSSTPGGTTLLDENFEQTWKFSDLVTLSDKITKGDLTIQLLKKGSISLDLPTTNYQNVKVQFSMAANSLDNNNEYVIAEYYNGSTWIELARISNGSAEEDGKMHPYSINLPESVNNLDKFALRFSINGSGSSDFGYIDNVIISANSSTNEPTTLLNDDFQLKWLFVGPINMQNGITDQGSVVRLLQRSYFARTFPTTDYRNVTVKFLLGANSLDTDDEYIVADYFNGSTWIELARISNGSAEEDGKMHPYSINLPESVNNLDKFALRFIMYGSDESDYGYVDDVIIQADAL